MSSSRSRRHQAPSQLRPKPAQPSQGLSASWRRLGLLAALVAACSASIALVIAVMGMRDDPPVSIDSPTSRNVAVSELPPLPASQFQNVMRGEYVGSARCVECHEDEHEGYRHTGMGRSLAKLDPQQEPPDAVIDHPASARRYEVVRRDGKMHHRELLLTGANEPALLGDYPISHVIGSGRHSRSYLLEIDGFMVESPVTWYESRQAWGMSPGYDVPYQQGFQRPVDQGCLYCHVGRSRPLDGTYHRMEIEEEWLSCERCHGPGSLHVARHEGPNRAPEAKNAVDYTIVNPIHLSRDLSVDVCAQCHLRSAASISVRGRQLDDFRPGLPMDAFRTDYRLDLPPSHMTVVGHVEQLRLSKCFLESQMTCTTCHNPHGMPRGEKRAAYYRAKCLTCHQVEQCDVDPAIRARDSADNDCAHCHMPSSATDIPHLAFTHHRIGLHDAADREASAAGSSALDRAVDLVPLSDLSQQSAADRARSLGGAYLELSQREEGLKFQEEYQQRAYALSLEAWDAGLHEPELAAHLAQLGVIFDSGRAAEFAEFVLAQRDAPVLARTNALLAMAQWHSVHNRFDQAVESVREVTRLRRVAGDWSLIGTFELRRGRSVQAIEALEKSLAIDPMQADLRRQLAAQYRREGNLERARWHEARLPLGTAAGP